MKRLILLRHAKTEPWYEGVDDHGRALIERGRLDAALVAGALVDEGWSPDLVLVSTARHARETWGAAVPVFPAARYQLEDNLYLAGAHGIEQVLADHDGAPTVMVIGHNPGMHDLACAILRVAGSQDHHSALRVTEKFPTGCAALFEAEEDGAYSPTGFKLAGVIRPKDLRGET